LSITWKTCTCSAQELAMNQRVCLSSSSLTTF
jgi:hypothetical protein